jgi:hypothetical protein
MMGTLHYRNPGDGTWVPLSTAGAAGADGPNEVVVADTMPVDSNVELWIDRDNDLGNSGWTALDYRYVNVTGDAMTGPLAMGSQKITGLANAVDPGDAMNQWTSDGRYLMKSSTTQTVTGPVTFTAATVVPTPVNTGDAATKGYVDGRVTVASTAPASPTTGQLWCPI